MSILSKISEKHLKNIIINVGFNGIKSLLNFALLPILTHYLSEGDMGVVGLYMAFVACAKQMNSANIQTFLWKKSFDKTVYSIYKVVAFWLTIIICGGLFVLSFIFHDYLHNLFGWYYLTLPLWGFLEAMVIIKNAEYFAEDKALSANWVTFSRIMVEFVIALLVVMFIDNTYIGRINGYLVGVGIVGIVSLIRFKPPKITWPEKQYFKDTLKFIVPFFPSMIFAWVIQFADRFMIEDLLGEDQAGVYTVAYSIGIVVLTLDSAISPVWTNIFYKKQNENGSLKEIFKMKMFYSAIITLGALFVWFIAPFIYEYMVDEKFAIGLQVVPYIAFAYLFNSIARTFMLIQWKAEKTAFISVSTTVAALLNVGLNYVFIQKYGIIGSGYATIITYFLMMVLNIIYSMRLVR